MNSSRWIFLFLTLIVLAVYGQVYDFDFVKLDDDLYVTENPHIREGLSVESVAWALMSTEHGHFWQPVLWLSLMLDAEIFGINAGGFHLVNVLFHILNVNLLFVLLKRMTGDIWTSAAAVALYAVHPLRVESVAWVTERKDVLSTFFGLLCLLAYVKYRQQGSRPAYVLSLVWFAVSLMSKQMMVTMPFLLLLLDFWPLCSEVTSVGIVKRNPQATRWGSLVYGKIPYFLLTAAFCVIAVGAQSSGGAVMSLQKLTMSMRLENAVVSYALYLKQTIWPVGLAAFYPHPLGAIPQWEVIVLGSVLLSMSVLAICLRHRLPWVFVGWFWYLGSLLPVIGLVQVGSQRMADRFTYVPHIGLFIAICWTVRAVILENINRRVALGVVFSVTLVVLMALSYRQTSHWRNTVTLMNHTLDVTGPNYVAHNNLAMHLLEQQRPGPAARHLRSALELNPENPMTYSNLGLAMTGLGRPEDAIDCFKQALEIQPELPHALTNLGNTLCDIGRADEGVEYLERARKAEPENPMSYNNLGMAYIDLGQNQRGIELLNRALELQPDFIPAHFNLGNALLSSKRERQAIEHFQAILKLDPHQADTYNSLGLAWHALGSREEAVRNFREALRLQPGMSEAQRNLQHANR
ncbi:MAG: tetratricopeptide repeat protein [Planctomycetota bacterium]|nr:tetratricopeptide repeat protein [Planctomycetota bacterium]MDA1214286.1 tetratricopeptide repeat protein [Planctomycetota bacterium]